MRVRLLIFDFDGVLADSFWPLYRLIRFSLRSVGIQLTTQQYRLLFLDNVHAAYRRLISDEAQYRQFSAYRKKHFATHYRWVKLFPEAVGLIKRAEQKYQLAIASSGQNEALGNLLRKSGIQDSFRIVSAADQSSKAPAIKNILRQSSITPAETGFISDTVGDLRLGRQLGLTTIAVSWGFHSADLLRPVGADFIASNFAQLTKQLDV